MKEKAKNSTMGCIQKRIFRSQLVLIISITLVLGVAGLLINVNYENEKRDQTLKNIADTVVQSLVLTEDENSVIVSEKQGDYLTFLRNTIEDIDVISVVNSDNIRIFHTTGNLIDTEYDGSLPDFSKNSSGYYIENNVGPSGTQRRAYAAIYDEDGNNLGFVMTVTLSKHIYQDIFKIVLVFGLIMLVAIFMELIISAKLSQKIKKELSGYEPDVFSAMYRIRDNIIESLEEGIVAVDNNGDVQFINQAGAKMLSDKADTFNLRNADFDNENI